MDSTKKSTQGLVILAALIFFLVGIGSAALVKPALAAKTTTVKVTTTFSGPQPTILPAGDDKAHVVGLGQRAGEAVFEDGRKGKYSNVFFMDWYRGKSMSVWGYSKILFEDGSWFFIKWDSRFTGRDEAGKPIFDGNGIILKGAGVYQGIQGTAKFQNRQVPPSDKHPKGATQAKAEFTYTLP